MFHFRWISPDGNKCNFLQVTNTLKEFLMTFSTWLKIKVTFVVCHLASIWLYTNKQKPNLYLFQVVHLYQDFDQFVAISSPTGDGNTYYSHIFVGSRYCLHHLVMNNTAIINVLIL